MSILLTLLKRDKYQPPAIVANALEEKRKAAIEWMGPRWVFHKAYVFNSKHRIYGAQ